MPPPNHLNKKKKNKKKESSAGNAFSSEKSSSSDKMPPLQPSVPRINAGPCGSMGIACGNTNLNPDRHSCCNCGESVHLLMPCSREHPEKDGEQICMVCFPILHPGFQMTAAEELATAEQFVGLGGKGNFDIDETFNGVNLCIGGTDAEAEIAKGPTALLHNAPLEVTQNDLNIRRNLNKTQLAQIAIGEEPLLPVGGVPAGGAEPSKKARGSGHTEEEIDLIAQAHDTTTEDPRNGTSQRKEVFEMKMWENYVVLVEAANEERKSQCFVRFPEKNTCPASMMCDIRDPTKLSRKWGEIRRLLMKFKGVVKQNPIMSGEDPDQHEARCLRMWEEQHGEPFKFVLAFRSVEESPKWQKSNEPEDEAGGGGGKRRKKLTKAEKDAIAAEKEQAKRPIGKRRKALNDKIASACADLGAGNNGLDDSGSGGDALCLLTSSIAGLADSLATQTWEEVDRIQCSENAAMVKNLQQQKLILEAQLELIELEQKKEALLGDKKPPAKPAGDDIDKPEPSSASASASARKSASVNLLEDSDDSDEDESPNISASTSATKTDSEDAEEVEVNVNEDADDEEESDDDDDDDEDQCH